MKEPRQELRPLGLETRNRQGQKDRTERDEMNDGRLFKKRF